MEKIKNEDWLKIRILLKNLKEFITVYDKTIEVVNSSSSTPAICETTSKNLEKIRQILISYEKMISKKEHVILLKRFLDEISRLEGMHESLTNDTRIEIIQEIGLLKDAIYACREREEGEQPQINCKELKDKIEKIKLYLLTSREVLLYAKNVSKIMLEELEIIEYSTTISEEEKREIKDALNKLKNFLNMIISLSDDALKNEIEILDSIKKEIGNINEDKASEIIGFLTKLQRKIGNLDNELKNLNNSFYILSLFRRYYLLRLENFLIELENVLKNKLNILYFKKNLGEELEKSLQKAIKKNKLANESISIKNKKVNIIKAMEILKDQFIDLEIIIKESVNLKKLLEEKRENLQKKIEEIINNIKSTSGSEESDSGYDMEERRIVYLEELKNKLIIVESKIKEVESLLNFYENLVRENVLLHSRELNELLSGFKEQTVQEVEKIKEMIKEHEENLNRASRDQN